MRAHIRRTLRSNEVIRVTSVGRSRSMSHKMKHYTGLFLLSILLVALLRIEYGAARELCPQENCLSADKCESPLLGGACKEQSAQCCSLVKSEFRTHCRHHGGMCMEKCNVALQHDVADCADGKVCCTLV